MIIGYGSYRLLLDWIGRGPKHHQRRLPSADTGCFKQIQNLVFKGNCVTEIGLPQRLWTWFWFSCFCVVLWFVWRLTFSVILFIGSVKLQFLFVFLVFGLKHLISILTSWHLLCSLLHSLAEPESYTVPFKSSWLTEWHIVKLRPL